MNLRLSSEPMKLCALESLAALDFLAGGGDDEDEGGCVDEDDALRCFLMK